MALTPDQVDELMERASRALVETQYFEAERLGMRALSAAREALDFERMARICLPLQEARRQRREQALDAGPVARVRSLHDLPRPLRPGCYLVQPPLIGRDGRRIRETAERKAVPACVLTREPLTRSGKWPVVAVGAMVARTQVDPPWPVERVEGSPSKDDDPRVPPSEWFAAASEALGDAAIARVLPTDHPHHRVDDLLDSLDAHPEHEKLHQALAAACRVAIGTEEPVLPRRRGIDDPFSF
ncbi:MAG TPA: hypothetical protein VFF69_11280 [Phycisphaerales bacterium]|nr:hypothetical protein [Phycisphaerales bacterium]